MTINEFIKEQQFLTGALFAFAGGALTFFASSLKDYISTKSKDRKEDKLFRRGLYGELLSLQMEFSQAIRNNDLAEIEWHYNIHYLVMVESNYELSVKGYEQEKNSAQVKKETTKILNEVKARFISKIGLYFFMKKKQTNAFGYLDQLEQIGMRFRPEEIKSKDLQEVVDLRYKQKIKYEIFWRKEVRDVTVEMIECVLHNN